MGVSFGAFSGSDCTLDNGGSGNFSVNKTGTGNYEITINDDVSRNIIVTTSVADPYLTATVIVPSTNGNKFTLRTGYTDQASTSSADVYYVSFIAMW
jgi:hypothetical protein